MRSYLSLIAVSVCAASVFATDARVETMGGTHSFMKDDQSIFVNPATVGGYGRLLMGSFGAYTKIGEDSAADAYSQQYNRDAMKPNFGATVSFGESEESKSKFTIGAMFNRYDPMLKYLDAGSQYYIGAPKESGAKFIPVEEMVGKTDVLAGVTLKNGLTIGVGTYMAFQTEKEKGVDKAKTSFNKVNLGVAGSVSDNLDFEAGLSVGSITLKGPQAIGIETVSSADKDMVITADVRAFADMPAINGKFVPHIQANIIKHHVDESILDFNGGVGLNSNIDRGFLWGGIEGIYQNDSYSILKNFRDSSSLGLFADSIGTRSRIGGKVSFGIERNILTDWLVWRVGGAKLLAYEKLNEGDATSYWVENSEDDHVSFGMGVNIEDRFKVDAVVAENMLYTFSNLFSGNSHHFSSKISATFSF